MEKAIEYTSWANELMAKAHHECFTSMQKLFVDVRADKISANKARRQARPRSEEPTAAGAESDGDNASDDDHPATSDGREASDDYCFPDDSPLEREDPEDEILESLPEDSYHSSPVPSHGNDDAEDRGIMHDVDNICDMLYASPLITPDALVRIKATVISFFLPCTIFL